MGQSDRIAASKCQGSGIEVIKISSVYPPPVTGVSSQTVPHPASSRTSLCRHKRSCRRHFRRYRTPECQKGSGRPLGGPRRREGWIRTNRSRYSCHLGTRRPVEGLVRTQCQLRKRRRFRSCRRSFRFPAPARWGRHRQGSSAGAKAVEHRLIRDAAAVR